MAIGDSYQLNWKSAIGVYKETAWASTYDTSTGAFVEFNSEGFKHKIDEKILTAINSQRESIKRILTNEMVEWKLDADLNPGSDAIVNLLKQAMGGTVSSATLTTTTYQHTLNVGDMESNANTTTATDMKGLHIQTRKGGSHVWEWLGCRTNQVTIKGEPGSPVTISFEGTAKTATLTGSTLSTTIAYTDVLPCVFHGVTIRNNASIGTFTNGNTTTSGTAETYQSFELTISNNLMTDLRQLGSRTVAALPQGGLNVSLKLSQRFDTSTAYGRWSSETALAFGIWLDTNYSVSTSGGSTYSMFIGLPRCYLNYETPQVGGRDGVLTHDLNFTCLRENTTGSYAVQFKINNVTASYP